MSETRDRGVLGTLGREWITLPAGTFHMGSDEFYPEEAPRHERTVHAFQLEATPVTNAHFAEFVSEMGYVTVAERALDADEFPGLTSAERAAGSLVFTPTDQPVDLRDWRQWWRWVPGASWRHPFGPGSTTVGREHHPVVQVAYPDAVAYAEWIGGRLPTEAEHEYAACGGHTPDPYAWGRERDPGDVIRANTWHGSFPYKNNGANGFLGSSPVRSFPPNPYGLFDLIGNVWEWTSTPMTPHHGAAASEADPTPSKCHCSPQKPSAPAGVRDRVLKGGSHLCAPEYCLRYRPAARSPQAEDSATTHIGFRVARDLP